MPKVTPFDICNDCVPDTTLEEIKESYRKAPKEIKRVMLFTMAKMVIPDGELTEVERDFLVGLVDSEVINYERMRGLDLSKMSKTLAKIAGTQNFVSEDDYNIFVNEVLKRLHSVVIEGESEHCEEPDCDDEVSMTLVGPKKRMEEIERLVTDYCNRNNGKVIDVSRGKE